MPPKKPPVKTTRPAAPSKAPVKNTAVKKTGTASVGTKTGAGKKLSSQPAPKNKTSEPTKAKKIEKKWTPQDEAARKIQTEIRRFLARKALARKKKEKEEYELLMENLEKEAFAKLVKMEQEKAEKERLKEEEERKRKREAAKRKKRMLEAAFDGDNDEIQAILKEVKDLDEKNGVGRDVIGIALRNRHLLEIVDCGDVHGNTPLSEAASGGTVDTIKLLIELGADPNTVGQFLRTPLYRAAFAGHLEAIQVLLVHGADPRVYAEDGQTPEQIASHDNIRELLTEWDIEQTERQLQKLEVSKVKRKEEERKRHEAEMSRLEGQMEEAEKDYKMKQKQIMKCSEELNKRIEEHDTAVATGFDRPHITLQAIQDAETEVEIAKLDFEKARDKVSALKLQYREQQKDNAEACGQDLPGLQVTIRELEDVLFRDVGNRIKDSGKWPLVIDTSGQAATFLRYRDTNYIHALSPQNMQEERIRLALLGSLRYGKPLVLDMMEVDMFDTCAMIFDNIQKNLMEAILNKSILSENVYGKLLKETDGPEYSKNNFNDLRLKQFKFIIMTKNPFPPDNLLDHTYCIRIHIPT